MDGREERWLEGGMEDWVFASYRVLMMVYNIITGCLDFVCYPAF
jgi:hypothetical protein